MFNTYFLSLSYPKTGFFFVSGANTLLNVSFFMMNDQTLKKSEKPGAMPRIFHIVISINAGV